MSRALGLAGLLLLIGVYACDAGHGFVKDDFNWILTSRIEHPAELGRLLGAATGFFRPLVSLSFALDYSLFGLHPLGYGLTNLALLLACVGALARLLQALHFDSRLALALALLWALNFHGINMAVLWISGRTALLVTLFGVAAAWAWIREWRALAAMFTMAAMWSKEEAFVLPAILAAWSLVGQGGGLVGAAKRTWALWLVAAISLACRVWTGAFTPASAPPIYQYQYDAATVGANALAYLDRVGTTPALALLVFWLAAGWPPPGLLDRPSDGTRRTSDLMLKGAIWALLAFAPTLFLPVRSSLYGVLPSVGVMLIIGGVAERLSARRGRSALVRASVVMLLVFLALVPVYRLRNRRYVLEAELSSAIVSQISALVATHPSGGLVLIKDVRDARPTAEQAFGPLADRAALLATNGAMQIWIDPRPAELSGVEPPAGLSSPIATLEVRGGRLRRIQ